MKSHYPNPAQSQRTTQEYPEASPELSQEALLTATGVIVSSFMAANSHRGQPLTKEDLPGIISSVQLALMTIPEATPTKVELTPAVPIRKSILPDYIICLEDGKKFKSLKRHLNTHYNMTPEAYREKWGLPTDYPMVAPNYAEARSELAKKMGLGVRFREDRKAAAAQTPPPASTKGKGSKAKTNQTATSS